MRKNEGGGAGNRLVAVYGKKEQRMERKGGLRGLEERK